METSMPGSTIPSMRAHGAAIMITVRNWHCHTTMLATNAMCSPEATSDVHSSQLVVRLLPIELGQQ